ncbi:hypothetical protein A0H81_09475 [Grifola frondosa]|uniref:Uncharacterized protein n=1 Tax=Grifola frondosa TaxID=5627 RepID=A0A1C7M385_GRIFR|nr:hypothetical protein A0H81_09475 [Grifola frondosa]
MIYRRASSLLRHFGCSAWTKLWTKYFVDPQMSTRQNKKRKGRSNAINRERTVTTLTEGPESSFLIPTPTEEPAGNIMSSPFSVNSSPNAGPPLASPAFTMSAPFAFPYNTYMSPMSGPSFPPQHPPQQFFPPPPPPQPSMLSPGQNDLEILENLKQAIKNGQHEFFRPVPQPAALASVYLGPKSASSQVPNPEQTPKDHPLSNLSQLSLQSPDLSLGAKDALPGRTNEFTSRFSTQPSDLRDATRKSVVWSSASETHATNNVLPASHPDSVSLTANHSSVVSQNTSSPFASAPASRSDASQRYESSSIPASASQPSKESKPSGLGTLSEGVDNAQRTSNNAATSSSTPTSRQGPPGFQKYDQQNNGRALAEKPVTGEGAQGSAPSDDASSVKPSAFEGKDEPRMRESGWSYRNGADDKLPRHEPERPGPPNGRPGDSRVGNGTGNGNDGNNRGPGLRDQRFYDREKDRDRDREREREKDRDWERERERDRRTDYMRFRDDRRNDDRPRPLDNRRPLEQRHYEPRYVRRYDSKPSNDSFNGASRPGPPDDRNPPDVRPTRSLGEERSITRIPADANPSRPPLPDDRRPLADDRQLRPPADDRRAPIPPSPSDRQTRLGDDRRPPPPSAVGDREVRVPEDRRPPIPPVAGDRPGVAPSDEHRPSPPTGERQVRPGDDRRPPASAIPAGERQVRPADDRRPPVPPPSSVERQGRPPNEERRPPPPPANTDRKPPGDDRRPPVPQISDGRAPRPAEASAPDTSAPRTSIDDRINVRSQPHAEDRNVRPPLPLEDRLSRPPPTLQERLGHTNSPGRPDDRLAPRLEDRLGRPAASLEERLSQAPAVDTRPPRPPPQSDDRLSRLPPPSAAAPPPSVSDRPVRPPGSDDRNILLAEPARPPPAHADRLGRPDDRGRPAVPDRFTRPATPADRGPAPRSYVPPPRAASVAREDARVFRPSSRSPTRSDVREFRPAGEPPRAAEISDMMDVDPSARFAEGRASYHRSPPPVTDAYPPRSERAWMPPGEAYPEDGSRRMQVDSQAYTREWRDDERGGYVDEWGTRQSWERPGTREYDRDGRFVERDAVPSNGWETREERERRVSFPLSDAPPPASRSFEQRPLSSRLTDGYPADDRGYVRDLDRGRYPPDTSPSSFSRVRPRSPSPLRRGADEMRPPLKRAREDTYAPGYYSPCPAVGEPPRAPPPSGDYPPRMRTPPPSRAPYYDDPRYAEGPGGVARVANQCRAFRLHVRRLRTQGRVMAETTDGTICHPEVKFQSYLNKMYRALIFLDPDLKTVCYRTYLFLAYFERYIHLRTS